MRNLKIALMSSWNDCCGIAVHAWLTGYSWLSMGHELLVFAPIRERPRGRIPMNVQDEPFVYRNWEMHRLGDKIEDDAPLDLFFDPKALLEEDFEILFVEKPTSIPISKFSRIFDVLKRKARVVAIMHEGRVPANRRFYDLRWNLATVFDDRFFNLYGYLLNADRVSVVPFPCHPVIYGDRHEARRELNLPLDDYLVLAFGIRACGLRPIMPVLERVAAILRAIIPVFPIPVTTTFPVQL